MSWVENSLRQSVHVNVYWGMQSQDSKREGERSVRQRGKAGVTALATAAEESSWNFGTEDVSTEPLHVEEVHCGKEMK